MLKADGTMCCPYEGICNSVRLPYGEIKMQDSRDLFPTDIIGVGVPIKILGCGLFLGGDQVH